jgi:hypothetical protein
MRVTGGKAQGCARVCAGLAGFPAGEVQAEARRWREHHDVGDTYVALHWRRGNEAFA